MTVGEIVRGHDVVDRARAENSLPHVDAISKHGGLAAVARQTLPWRLPLRRSIRVIDALILTKDDDGAADAMELSDVADLGELVALEAQLAELLAADDVAHLAAAMEPGSTAGVLIWENLWAAPFAAAARRSGGQLIANGRIPIQAIIASIEADNATETVGA